MPNKFNVTNHRVICSWLGILLQLYTVTARNRDNKMHRKMMIQYSGTNSTFPQLNAKAVIPYA